MSHALPPPGHGSSVSNAVDAASAGSKLSKIRSATARARRSSLTRRITWAALLGGRPSSMAAQILQTHSDSEPWDRDHQARSTARSSGRWPAGQWLVARGRNATSARASAKENTRKNKQKCLHFLLFPLPNWDFSKGYEQKNKKIPLPSNSPSGLRRSGLNATFCNNPSDPANSNP